MRRLTTQHYHEGEGSVLTMSTPSVQNLEEAANIASEYIASLDNVPSEVQFLLQEIRTKDQRCQEIHQEVTKEANRYIRHSLKAETDAAKDKPFPPSPIEHIREARQTLAALSEEKIALTQRVIELLNRKRGRLDHDLRRVLLLQGDTEAAAVVAAGVPLSLSSAGTGYALGGRNPAQQITESLRNAYGTTAVSAGNSISASQSRVPVAEEGLYKKRKLNSTQASIRLSPAPSSAYAPGRSRGRKKAESEDLDLDFEEEPQGTEELEGEEMEAEDGDDGPYCFCQSGSYGEMIGCDNEGCPYQWFHLPCVNLTKPLPERWFCDECIKKGFKPTSSGRKARKK